MKAYRIPKLTHTISWDELNPLTDFSYPWQKEKAPMTTFNAYYDENHIHFRYDSWGPKPIVYVENNDKSEVIDSERIELFFRRDEKMQPYYCLEIDPNGRVLDYKANFYREFDLDWVWPEPLDIQTNIEEGKYIVQGKLGIPVLKRLGLLKDGQIQIGLFRGHCIALKANKASLKWISWVDSKTEEPDFHVPTAFGILILE